jgi:hypothetical protein
VEICAIMDAERAIELLPWYVNGGLEPEERREVAAALAASAEVRRELADVRRAFELHGYRPEPEVLLDYALGLEPEGVTRETVETLAALLPSVREELDMMREGLGSLQSVGPAATRGGGVEPARAPWRRGAIAASLLAAAFLGAWAWSSHRLGLRSQELQLVRARLEAADAERNELVRRLETLPKWSETGALVSADLVVTDLFPTGMVLRGEAEEGNAVAIVQRQTRRVVLLLNSRLPDTTEIAGLALRDASGVEIWTSSEPVVRGEHGEYALLLPVRELEAGLYTLELLGATSDAQAVLEVYRLRLG